MTLTDTQRAILAVIAERIEAEGLPPSQAEIARALGFRSLRAAQYHLEALEAAGAIERLPGRARGLRLRVPVPGRQPELPFAKAAASDEMLHLPILGRVAAGAPIGSGAEAGEEGVLAMDRGLFRPAPDYLLRVEGDSMREEGILDGDLVGVQRTSQARSGQIVVARIDEEITIKRLETSAQGIRLLACNADYAPITVSADADFAVEGIYCGLLRPNRSLGR